MADRDPDQPGRLRPRPGLAGAAPHGAFVLAVLFALSACSHRGEPQVAVSELSWACSASRCTATFRLTAAAEAESVVARVRAYAGENVAERAIVGEYSEMLTLGAGQSRRITAAIDTERPANRVRVIVQRAQ
jgi:hypothetical protein